MWTVTRGAHRWIAAGYSGIPNHVDAWISTDLHTWEPLPETLHGGAGGTLSLIAEVDGRVVLVGTAPELDRYYTFGGEAVPALAPVQTRSVDDAATTVPQLAGARSR